MKFIMYGASDDLLEFEGDVRGEVGCYDQNVEVRIGDPGARAFVTWGHGGIVGYRDTGAVWEAAIRQEDEGVPLPGAFTIRRADSVRPGEVGYSVVVEVEVPDGTPVLYRTVPRPAPAHYLPRGWQVPS